MAPRRPPARARHTASAAHILTRYTARSGADAGDTLDLISIEGMADAYSVGAGRFPFCVRVRWGVLNFFRR